MIPEDDTPGKHRIEQVSAPVFDEQGDVGAHPRPRRLLARPHPRAARRIRGAAALGHGAPALRAARRAATRRVRACPRPRADVAGASFLFGCQWAVERTSRVTSGSSWDLRSGKLGRCSSGTVTGGRLRVTVQRSGGSGWRWEAVAARFLGGEVGVEDPSEAVGLVGVADQRPGAVGDELGVMAGEHGHEVGDVVGATPAARARGGAPRGRGATRSWCRSGTARRATAPRAGSSG